MKKSEIIFGALRLPLDFFGVVAAFFLAYYLRPLTDLIPGVQYPFGPELLPPIGEYGRLAVASALFLVFLFAVNHLYVMRATQRLGKSLFRIVFLVTAWMMFIISYYFLVIHQLFFSRIALAQIWLFSLIFVVVGRGLIQLVQSFLLRHGIGKRRVLLVGTNGVAERFFEAVSAQGIYEVVGALTTGSPPTEKKDGPRIIGGLSDLEAAVKECGVEEIVQADARLGDAETRNLHAFCRSRHINYHFIPDAVRLQRANVEVEMVKDIPLVSLRQTPLDGWGHIFKRIFDLAASLILIIVLIPVWAVVALLIKLDSQGPVIYKSRRKYRDRIFNVYKFRSMVQEADSQKNELLALNERKGPLFKIKNDPRVTRMGRFLRKTSLDELPQLFNVLFGSMSLVGPRPHLPEEIDQYETRHLQVFALKPGMTGLSQISGRSNLDFEDEFTLDIYYIENWSLWLDLKLILKSAAVIFRADGS